MREGELILAAQQGDLTAMEALYRAHRVKAYQTALIVLRDPHLADDIVQEASIRAFREIGRCDPDRPFAPWLMRIVINLCRNALRGQRVLLPLAALEWMGRRDPGYGAIEAETDVWQSLQLLPHRHREILILRYFNEFSEQEIADILGIPLGTVKSRLHWARREMRRLLQGPTVEGKEAWPNG